MIWAACPADCLDGESLVGWFVGGLVEISRKPPPRTPLVQCNCQGLGIRPRYEATISWWLACLIALSMVSWVDLIGVSDQLKKEISISHVVYSNIKF